MELIRRIYANHKKHIWRYIILCIIGNLCAAAGIRVLQWILDGLAGGNVELWLLALYALLLLEPLVGAYLDNHPDQSLRHGIYFQLKTEALEKMRTVSYTVWQKFGMGTLIQRVEAGAEAGRGIFCDFYIRLVAEMAPQIIITAIFIALTDMRVFYWVMAGYVAVFIITNLLLKKLYSIKDCILNSEEAFNHRLVRGFMELVVFRIYRRFGEEVRRARAEAETVRSSRVKIVMIHEAFFALFAVLVGFLKLGVLGYAIAAKSLTVGGVVALMSYLDSAYQPIAIFNVCYVDYKLNLVAYERLEQFMRSADTPNILSGERADVRDGGVKFENVGCAYDGKRVFDGLSFEIPAGAVVGIAGESGSGKSSVMRQLAGLIPVSCGSVHVGGVDVSRVCLDEYYRYISYTPQETPVFDATLRENIVFGEKADDTALWQALENVELAELASTLPEGLDTRIGEHGITLSGGERQRLSLARLFFAENARLFMLDEATSALDNVTEENVLGRLMEALKGRTVVMIAHRLDTLKNADFILLMKDGKLAGQGNYAELARSNAYFSELLRSESEKN